MTTVIIVRGMHFDACRLFADECVPPDRNAIFGAEGRRAPRLAAQHDDVMRQRLGAVALALYLQRDPREVIDWHCEPHMRADVRAAWSIDITTSAHADCSLLVLPRRQLHAARLALARVELQAEQGAALRLLGWVPMDVRRTFRVVDDERQAAQVGAPVGARWYPIGELRRMEDVEAPI